MPELKRAEPSPSLEAPDRESRVEALLVDGLDRYFDGQYEQAIHLWTRVLFLDRTHARARAYIDRARTALAEQQRRAEEMLHASGELIAQGRTDQARDLLARAVAASGDEARATALRWRLEHIERARAAEASRETPAPGPSPSDEPVRRARFDGRWLVWAAGAGALVLLAVTLRPVAKAALGLSPVDPALPAAIEPASRPVLSSTDVAFVRARTLYARGRLAEALQALDRVDPQSASRAAADLLRLEIQQVLLQTGRASAFDARPRSVTGSQP